MGGGEALAHKAQQTTTRTDSGLDSAGDTSSGEISLELSWNLLAAELVETVGG